MARRLWQLRAANGSLQADPDGDPRGARAIDLQTVRASSDQVASGDDSSIFGGINNKCSSAFSLAFGSTNVLETFALASLAGGEQNTVQGSHSLAMGFQNTVEFGGIPTASIVCGVQNRVTEQYCAAFGDKNWTAGQESLAIGSNCKTDTWRAFAMGDHARAWEYGQFAWSNGPLYTETTTTPGGGDDFNMVGTITTVYGWATPGNVVNLSSNGAKDGTPIAFGREIRVQPDYTQIWRMTIVGREHVTGQSAYWLIRATARRIGAADATLLESVVLETFNPDSWPSPVVSIVTPDVFRVSCSGAGATNKRHYFCTGQQIYIRTKESP